MNTPPPYALDPSIILRAADHAARQDRADNFLAREIARRMNERLDYTRTQPRRVLDLGCGTGPDLHALARRYPDAQCIGVDLSAPSLAPLAPKRGWLARLSRRPPPVALRADALALPFSQGCFDLVWSNLLLQSLTDPGALFREAHRVLNIDGLLTFSTLGPDTLKELRAAFGQTTPSGERYVHRFIDMHDLGDALIGAGFSDPVMDMELITLTYPDLDSLIRELRSGGGNARTDRPRGLQGKTAWQAMRRAYEGLAQDGRLPLTIELIQGHAWKAPPKTCADGRQIIQFRRPAPPRASTPD